MKPSNQRLSILESILYIIFFFKTLQFLCLPKKNQQSLFVWYGLDLSKLFFFVWNNIKTFFGVKRWVYVMCVIIFNLRLYMYIFIIHTFSTSTSFSEFNFAIKKKSEYFQYRPPCQEGPGPSLFAFLYNEF